jgi:hypothetical protein
VTAVDDEFIFLKQGDNCRRHLFAVWLPPISTHLGLPLLLYPNIDADLDSGLWEEIMLDLVVLLDVLEVH